MTVLGSIFGGPRCAPDAAADEALASSWLIVIVLGSLPMVEATPLLKLRFRPASLLGSTNQYGTWRARQSWVRPPATAIVDGVTVCNQTQWHLGGRGGHGLSETPSPAGVTTEVSWCRRADSCNIASTSTAMENEADRVAAPMATATRHECGSVAAQDGVEVDHPPEHVV